MILLGILGTLILFRIPFLGFSGTLAFLRGYIGNQRGKHGDHVCSQSFWKKNHKGFSIFHKVFITFCRVRALKILRAPAEVSTSTENEILESLKKDAKAKSGDYLAGKFRVAEIRERDGYKTFFIDPTVTKLLAMISLIE